MLLDRERKSLELIGGLAGILAGIILIFAYGLLTVGYPPQTCCTEEFFRQLPQFKTAAVISSMLIPSAWVLGMPLFIALYADLKETSKRYALLGTVAGLIGAGVASITLFEGTLNWLGLSELYETTPDSAKNVVVAAAETMEMAGASLLGPILILLIIAFVAIGMAMLRAGAFRRASGWASIILGGLLLASLPLSGVLMFLHWWMPVLFAFIVIPTIVWLLYMGFQVYRLSR